MNLAARCPQDMRPDVRVLCGHLTIMTTWPDHTCEMDQSGDPVSREAESLVTEALADTRVVTLNGARQAGKSTLARITALKHPNTVARLHHYRTKDKVEVDAILETPDGRVVAIEVKAGATVRSEDLAGLRHLAQRLGPGSRIRPLQRCVTCPFRR